jgi:hypothetical protein
LEEVFAFVLAAFFKIAANAPRVIGRIFFRVSLRGSRFFCLRFIGLLYHARRALRIGKGESLLYAIAPSRQIASYKPVEDGASRSLQEPKVYYSL